MSTNNFINANGTYSSFYQIGGINGATIYQGNGVPPNILGNSGDIFTSTSLGVLYIKEGQLWVPATSSSSSVFYSIQMVTGNAVIGADTSYTSYLATLVAAPYSTTVLTLPAPKNGLYVVVKDISGTASFNYPIQITDDSDMNYNIDIAYGSVKFLYTGLKWVVISAMTSYPINEMKLGGGPVTPYPLITIDVSPASIMYNTPFTVSGSVYPLDAPVNVSLSTNSSETFSNFIAATVTNGSWTVELTSDLSPPDIYIFAWQAANEILVASVSIIENDTVSIDTPPTNCYENVPFTITGEIVPSNENVQIGYSSSSSISPTSWTSATVTDETWNALLSIPDVGNYYVWAQIENTNVSVNAEVTLSNSPIAIVNPQTQAYVNDDLSWVVDDNGILCDFFQFLTPTSTPPSSDDNNWAPCFSLTPTSNAIGGNAVAITETTTMASTPSGTYYMWIRMDSQPNVTVGYPVVVSEVPAEDAQFVAGGCILNGSGVNVPAAGSVWNGPWTQTNDSVVYPGPGVYTSVYSTLSTSQGGWYMLFTTMMDNGYFPYDAVAYGYFTDEVATSQPSSGGKLMVCLIQSNPGSGYDNIQITTYDNTNPTTPGTVYFSFWVTSESVPSFNFGMYYTDPITITDQTDSISINTPSNCYATVSFTVTGKIVPWNEISQVGYSSSLSTLPDIWITATSSNGSWSTNIMISETGDYYLWAQIEGTNINTNIAITVGTSLLGIVNPPTQAYIGDLLQWLVVDNGTLCDYFGCLTSGTAAPASSDANWYVCSSLSNDGDSISAESEALNETDYNNRTTTSTTPGTYYQWIRIDNQQSVTVCYPIVLSAVPTGASHVTNYTGVNLPQTPSETIGPYNILSASHGGWTEYFSFPLSFTISPPSDLIAYGYFTNEIATAQPSTGGILLEIYTSGSLIDGISFSIYNLNNTNPTTPGIMYFSMWATSVSDPSFNFGIYWSDEITITA